MTYFTELSSNSMLFGDDTSLFSVARDMTSPANILNNDLLKIMGISMENEF